MEEAQESSGKQLRREFWQVMWLPLTLYLIGGYDMELGYGLYCAVELTCICFWNFCERNDTFNKWLSCVLPYSTAVVVLGPVGRLAINRVFFGGENVVVKWLEEAGSIAEWEDLMISAAIVLLIVHFFLLSRTVEKTPYKILAIHIIFYSFLAATVYAVHYTVTTAEGSQYEYMRDMQFEGLANDFVNASLAALCLCVPVLYSGFSARRTTVLVCLLVLLFYPIVFMTKVLVVARMKIWPVYPSTGSTQALATDYSRVYRTSVGIVLLSIGFAVEPLWIRLFDE